MGWRDIKAKARDTVHQTMKVKCVYMPTGVPPDSNSGSGDGLHELEVRIHEHQVPLGDQAGTSLNSAQRIEPDPRAIFWRSELIAKGITLARNAVLSVADGEAYRLGPVKPHDQETISVPITRIKPSETVGFPLPEA